MAAPVLQDTVFEQAIAIADEHERAAYLDRACGGDTNLRREAERLVRDHFRAGSFLEQPAIALDVTLRQAAEQVGSQIGPYKLLEQIGEGGMGLVYMAEQQRPVRRLVALKIIKPGMDSKQVIARFEAERQALAMMDHPNIAKVHDAGTTAPTDGGYPGRPYFVMELVRGIPINEFCDQQRLTVRQRLELFIQVCQAVQHAHQKGIIHRDLKPTNVLVTKADTQSVPKVIDFGIAKALSASLTEQTLHTGFAQLVGTPLYMSPEQAEMNQFGVDTRSDVYSLGVLLYELLTGTTPFDKETLGKAGLDEMRRIIREDDPPRPSARVSTLQAQNLSTISQQRNTDPRRISAALRGDLDWIVMKTLEKDRSRRYESAAALAGDIQRYLSDEPVLACPPTAMYRLRKFARRNKGPVAAAAVLGLALLVVVSAIGWAMRDRLARQEEARRDQTTRQAKLTGQLQLILDQVARLEGEQKWPEALEAASRAADLVKGGEADEAAVSRVKSAMGDLELVRLLDDIRASRSEMFNERRFDFRATADHYAAALKEAGIDLSLLSAEEAAHRFRSRSAVLAALLPALDDWAICYQASGSDQDANNVWKVAELVDSDTLRKQIRQALRSKDDTTLQALVESPDLVRQSAATLTCLEVALRERGRVDAAMSVLSLAQRQHPTDFWVHFGMGQALSNKKPPNHEQVAACYRAALAVQPRSAAAWNNLGSALKSQNKLDDAGACYQRSIELDPKYFMAYSNLGLVFYKQEKLDDAIATWRRAIELYQKAPLIYSNLGHALLTQGKIDEATACFYKAVELEPNFAVAQFNLGAALAKQQKLDDAIASYRRAVEIEPKFVLAHQRLAAILFTKRDFASAIEVIQKVISLQPELPGPRQNLAVALNFVGREQEAIASHRKALQLKPDYAEAYISLARLLTTCSEEQLRDPAEALELARKGVELAPRSAEAWQVLGAAQYRSGDVKASVEALEKSISLQASPQSSNAWQSFFLAMAHWQLGEKDEALRCYEQAFAQMNQFTAADNELLRIQNETEALLKEALVKNDC